MTQRNNKQKFYVDIAAVHPEVTGSSILCIVKNTDPKVKTIKFLVDCGLFQEEYGTLNETLPFNSQELDFVIVTHNHVDHTGRLPLLVKKGFSNKIITTKYTKKLIKLALEDSCKVLEDVAKRNNKPPLYKHEHVEATLPLVEGYNFDRRFNIMPNVKVTFFRNGHLVGASVVLVQISAENSENINILFTGDYNNKNVFFRVPDLPQWVLDLPLTIVQEATYGDMNSNEINYCFEENILEAVNKKKNIVIPVFSLGRAQEILYFLKQLQETGKLDPNYPIYLDGKLSQRYTNIYLNDNIGIDKEKKELLPKNLEWITHETRTEIVEKINSKIVVTSSGMGSYGPAQTHIPKVLSNSNGLIHFTGYMAEGTLGRKLETANPGDYIMVGGLFIKKRGVVKYTNEFSAHAKADEMIEFLQKFTNLKFVLINHGEKEVKKVFASRVLEEVKPKNIGILGHEYMFRINSYGFVKSLPTKFI